MTLSLRSVWQVLRQEALKSISSHAGEKISADAEKGLIIAPHPDDEIFGCGGLLAGGTEKGRETNILFLTGGDSSHKGCCKVQASQIGAERRRLAVSANKILGVPQNCLHFLQKNDGSLPRKGQDGFSDLTATIAGHLEKLEPDAVFCPHPFEGWADHIAAEELTRAAITMLPKRPKLYHYCVWFWYTMPLKRALLINWHQARLLDIAEHLPLKQKAMQVYLNSLAPCGNPWVGKLPPVFLRACKWNKELFFEADSTQ